MSKTTKIILGIIGAGIVISFGIIRMNGKEYNIETITYQNEGREQHCYNGVGAVSTIKNSGGAVVGCVTYGCGGLENGYYETTTHPGNGCSGGTTQEQFECTVDNCIANGLGENPLTQDEMQKALHKYKLAK
jgi:hypothetical protein